MRIPKIGEMVKRVSRNNDVHYGLVIDVLPCGRWFEVEWLKGCGAKISRTIDPECNLEVIAQCE